MSQVQVAGGPDRLPWLEDDPTPPAESRLVEIAGWVVAAALLLAGIIFWFSRDSGSQTSSPRRTASSTTVALPQAQVIPRESEPEGIPSSGSPITGAAPGQQLATPGADSSNRQQQQPAITGKKARVGNPVRRRSPPQSVPTTGRQSNGHDLVSSSSAPLAQAPAVPLQPTQAYGRIVRIGAFGSTHQAKLGWRYMVHSYPAVAHLHAKVVQSRNSAGTPFYRFEIGTSSQAHSEVLCQWMGRIHLSCAVVGLPWKPKGVER
jgi:hypothetical protein